MAQPSVTALNFTPKPGSQYKIMYLAQRNPALTADEFPEAWRSHSVLASKFAGSLGSHFRSVHQCAKDHATQLDARFENDRDGCAILAMKSWPDLLAARYHPHSLEEMLNDEKRVFSDFVDQWSMAVEEQFASGGAPTGNVLLAFVHRKDNADRARFCEQSRTLAESLLTLPQPPARLVWSAVVDPAAAFHFDAVIEAWYPDRETALAAARDPAVAAVLEQAELAEPNKGICLLARLNHAKAM